MLEIVQAGQVGKTNLLFEMHRFRKRVFKDRMGWDVHVSPGGLEIDNFDVPEALYFLVFNNEREIVGSWRLVPSDGPTMIRDLWPQFLASIDMPYDRRVWEISRFALDSPLGDSEAGIAQRNRAAQELFCGVTEFGLMCGVRQLFAMHDMRVAKLLKRMDCEPAAVSEKIELGKDLCQVSSFTLNKDMLARLRAASGISYPLVTPDMIPPTLEHYLKRHDAVVNRLFAKVE